MDHGHGDNFSYMGPKLKKKYNQPIEEALEIMQKVIVASNSGESPIPQGKSTINKLESLRSDSAAKLLAEKTTWHEFFVPETERKSKLVLSQHFRKGSTAATSSQRRPSSANRGSDQDQESFPTGGDDELADDFGLEESFHEMTTHIEILWDELKIPFPDQKFYKDSLLKGPPSGIEQCQEVGRYINMLKLHRKATINTLRAIQQREMALEKLFDFLYIIAQMNTRMNRRQGSTAAAASYASNMMLDELVQLLRELQWANIETIRAIQRWRRNLWRPLPFVWNGCNYLVKMYSDTNVILTDNFTDLLANVPVKKDDLICIVFGQQHQQGREGKNRSSPERNLESSSPQRTMHTVGSTLSHDPGNNVDVLAAAQAAYDADSQSQTGNDNNLREKFFVDRDLRELRAAVRVVDDENKLQKALKVEHKSLVAMNVFIPLLKLEAQPTRSNIEEK